MGRQSTKQPTAPDPDVDTSEEGEETAGTPEASEGAPKAAKKAPARGKLPEGYVTPVGLAKVLGERGLQKNKAGETLTTVPPQMVYSYMRNAGEKDPFPIETVKDDQGNERQALLLEKGIEWWERKNARAATRAENARAKAAKAAEKKTEGESSTDEAEATGDEAEAE